MSKSLFPLCIAFLLLVPSAFAKPGKVYSWTDEKGVTHYSSDRNADPAAQPADLPPINRGDVKITKQKLVSCSNHGGIDCQAGADNDGSVICYDGFRGAAPIYRFSCNAPKLQITEVSEVDNFGNFTVTVRNAKSVAAKTPNLIYKPQSGEDIPLKGPEQIEPFGIAEFRFQPQDADIPQGPISLAQLSVECANCP